MNEVAEFNPKSELPDEFEYVDLESVVGTEMISHRTETKDSAPSRAQRLAQPGDVFFQTVRPYQKNNYLFSKLDNNYVFSTGYAQMRPNIDTAFLMSFLQTDSFVKIVLDNCTGTSYPAINSSDLSNLEISLPKSFEEQKKVGKTIISIDNLITLHQRKSFLYFSRINDWEQRKLGEIVERVTRKNQDLVSELPLTISAQYGLIDQNEFFDKRVASKDVSGYYLIYNGEFAYNKSTSSDAPWGAIKRLDRYENGVLSTLYIVFRIKNEDILNSDFLMNYYDTNNWHKDIQAIAAEGARNHGLLNIAPADFFETELMLPQDIEEQKNIGNYFKSLNNLITLHQRKCDETKKLKKFMLQKMFPKKDAKKPEIRFAGFTNDWEQRKLGDWGDFYYGRSCPKWSVTEDATIPCIRYGELYTKFGAKIDRVYSYTNMPPENLRFSKGTEVLIPRVGEDPMDYNHCTWLSMKDVAIGEMISVFNTDNNPLFTATMFNATLQNEFAMRVEGGSVTNLYFEKLKNIDVSFPSIREQEMIAAYFENIDNLITLHQRKCDELKEFKKYMLQNMFPQKG